MELLMFIFVAAVAVISDGLTVHGPSGLLVVPLGSTVVLPCYVDEPLLIMGLEVEWRRTDPETLVHLYQDGESQPGAQQQDYLDRAHFFTDQIQHGNFALRLDNLRAKDQGQYTCKVYSQQDYGETEFQIKVVEHFQVSGLSRPISATMGDDVTLHCSVDSHIITEHIKMVSWKKTDEDDILVLLYQDNKALPDLSNEQYRDRVEFFTDEIPKGNFSLRLKNVGTRDKGVYMCQVFAGNLSANATAELEGLGLTVHGPSGPLVVPLGSTVVLPCYIDEPLLIMGLEVEWRRTGSETLVHLYQDGESRPEAQQQDYLDRAHFFTDQIQHGNFALRLDNLRAEDEGQYTCKVYSQQYYGETKIQIKVVERLLVSGLSRSISATVGDDVTLNCSVDSHITTEHIKIVSWRKTDEDDILVLLYQDNAALPALSNEQYRDRVEFFTDEIPKGNFSLKLKNVRTRDKGVYMCQVFAGSLSASATAELERLGLSVSQTMVLILCISASGSALLLCCLIYCKSTTKGLIVQNSCEDNLEDSVVLPCHVHQKLLTKGLKVEWRRTRRISNTLVHLYQDGKSRAEKQDKYFKGRAHFFTDPIKHGNFSLRLDNLRAEDEGQYTCRVYSKRTCVFSNTTHLVYRKQDGVQSTKPKSGFIVKHHYTPVPLGSSVVLPFYSEPLEVEGLQVDWRSKGKALILYQDGESRPEVQQEDFLDRARFFTDQIQHGNFSLRLDNLKAEDEGQYTCRVYRHFSWNDMFSAKINLVMKLLDTVFRLHMFLVFFPNIMMFLAFVFWGVSEGSVNESVSCCALYFLRPLLIFWAAPYINEFTDKIKTWILNYSYVAEYVVFSIIVYSALFTTAWQKLLNIAVFDRVVIIVLFSVLFSIVFLCCLCKIIYFTQNEKKRGQTIEIFDLVADMMFDILPTLQFILLFYMFGSSGAGFIIVVMLPVLLMMTDDRCFDRCRCRLSCSPSVTRTVMLIFILVINAVIICFYMTLEKTTDQVGWGCVMVYLQIHWAVVKFTDPYYLISFSQNFHRFVPVYVFGSVGFILLTSTALTTELILKAVNGDRTVGDLRFIVFPFECFFAVSLLLSGLFASKITNCIQSCQKQNTAETQQIKYTKADDEDEDSVVLSVENK